MSGHLPTALWVDATLKTLADTGTYYYFIQKGNHGSGMVMLKLNGLKGRVRLIEQQRNFMTDAIEWIDSLDQEYVEESNADAYIHRAITRDPDLWVVEIEDEAMTNPFDES